MDLIQTTQKVIADAIKTRASKQNYRTSEVQLVLYVESENKIGVVFCKNGNAEVKSSINSILGSYALIPTVSKNTNETIYKSFEKFAKQKECSLLTLQVRLYILNELLSADLYINNQFEKKITIEEILN